MAKGRKKTKHEKKLALFWNKEKKGIRCFLCSRKCFILPDKKGFCDVRFNQGNKLYTTNFGRILDIEIATIEKYHIFHFFPGSKALGVFLPGDNISKKETEMKTKIVTPEKLVEKARKLKVKSIVFLGESSLSLEFIMLVARNAKRVNIKTIMNTNGLITPQAIKKASKYVDGILFNLDASLSQQFYQNFYKIRNVKAIKQSIVQAKKNRMHIEITNRIIPKLGEDLDEAIKFSQWISTDLGSNIPLHYLRFYPNEMFPELPMTPDEILEKAWTESRRVGLRYVYIDEMPGHPAEDTYCFNCRILLIDREAYSVVSNFLYKDRCPNCGIKIDVETD